IAQSRHGGIGAVEDVTGFLHEDIEQILVEIGNVERAIGLRIAGEQRVRRLAGNLAFTLRGSAFGFEALGFGLLRGNALGFEALGLGLLRGNALGFEAFGLGLLRGNALGFEALGLGLFR